jgi:NADPH-dependent 2,4-dienoyl-CoA reductase/sulfur reductase-like enzyme
MTELIRISIDGQPCQVPGGITVAAALALVGNGLTRRSLGAMPRTPFCGMGICQECRVTINGRAHCLACQRLCEQGMAISTSQEITQVPDPASTFAQGQRLDSAASCRESLETTLQCPENEALFFDILVIGAGPAGLAAAQAAASGGGRVGVIDDNPQAGGQIWRHGPDIPAPKQARTLIKELGSTANVTLLHNTRVVQQLAPDYLLLEGLKRGSIVRFRQLILATGARERLLPFPGWTLPGVTGAGGLQALIKGGMPVAGQRIVIAGSGPLLFAVAATAQAQGAHIVAIIEQAPPAAVARLLGSLLHTPGKLAQAALLRFGLRGTPYLLDSHVISASGDETLKTLSVRHRTRLFSLSCDRLACAYGLIPNVRVAQALQCELEDAAIRIDAMQVTSRPAVFAAGECTGIGGMELSLTEGYIAGYAAIGNIAAAHALFGQRAKWRRFATRLARYFALSPALRNLPDAHTILCRCEDIPYGTVAAHGDWRHAKLHTRCGMGPCQGQVCGTAAGFCLGWPDQAVRAPFSPTRIGTLMQVDHTETPGLRRLVDGVFI